MTQLNRIALLLTLTCTALFGAGCALVWSKTKDVTADPKFHVVYKPGQAYHTKAEGRLIQVSDRYELWSPALEAYYNAHKAYTSYFEYGKTIAMLPAGMLVRVDGLEHNYTVAIPPVPGDSQILRAYGTVTTATESWSRVRLPDDQGAAWRFVPGTGVMSFPKDARFFDDPE